jgi:hypothetical protein
MNLVGLLFLGVVSPELGLNRLRALDGVHDGGELDQEAITRGLDDMALVGRDRLILIQAS